MIKKYKHFITDAIPEKEKMEQGVLYISLKYNICIHLCPCGCKNEVALPISPNNWQIIYTGVNVSLTPSIGSFDLKCKSHYFLVDGKIKWYKPLSFEDIKFYRYMDSTDSVWDKFYSRFDK